MSDASVIRTVTASSVGKTLMVIAASLTLMHIIAMSIWYLDLIDTNQWLYFEFFDLDEEESFGTWFSTLLLLAAGQLTLLHSRAVAHQLRGQYHYWRWLAIGFHLLSIDELVGFHEFINTVVKETHWTSYGLAVTLVVGAAYVPFLWTLPWRIRWLFIASGFIYIGGAVGVEWGTIYYEETDQLNTLAYNLWNALEEAMEMAGIILFIYTLLGHMAAHPKNQMINIKFCP